MVGRFLNRVSMIELHKPLFLCLALSPSILAAQSESLAGKVEAIALEQLAQPGAVGLSIGVGQDGKVVLEAGYGTANAEFDVPADAETMFRIGSVTKQFTAAAVMQLVEKERLKLDQSLMEHVDAFPTGERTVTIRQLLNHTSGVSSYTSRGDAWRKVWPLELSDAELLALIEDKPFDFEPGTDWNYSNTGYYLLGMVLEAVTETSYADVVVNALCAPIGLSHTRYDSNRDLIKNRAQGYSWRDGQLCNDAALGMRQPGGAGGLLSTGGDLVRWAIALSSGKVVRPESYEAMIAKTTLPNGRNVDYGFGLETDEYEGRQRVQHGGGIHGFNSMLMWFPESKTTIAVISNGEALSSSRVAMAIADLILEVEQVNLPIDEAVGKKIFGSYRIEKFGMNFKVFERDGKAMLKPDGQSESAIEWQGGLEFRAAFDRSIKIIFSEDGSQFELHQGGVHIAERQS